MPRSHALLIVLCAAMMAHTSLAATLNGQFAIRTFYANTGCSGSITSTFQYSNDCTYIPSQSVWARFGCSSDLVQGATKVAMAVYTSAGCTGTPSTVSDLGVTLGCSNYEQITCSNTALAPAAGDLGKLSVAGGTACASGNTLGSGYIRSNNPICVDGVQVSCTNSVTTVQTFSGNTCSGTATSTTTGACAAAAGLSWSCTTYPPPTLNGQFAQRAFYAAADCSGSAAAVMQFNPGCTYIPSQNVWVRFGCSTTLVQGSTKVAMAVYSNAACSGTPNPVSDIGLTLGCAAGQKITCENTALAASAADVATVSIAGGASCASANVLASGYLRSTSPLCVDGNKFSCANNIATIQEFAANTQNCAGTPIRTNTSACAVISTGDLSWSCANVAKSGAASLLNNSHAQLSLAIIVMMAALLA